MKNFCVIRVLLFGCLAVSVLAQGQEKPATYPESANGFRQYLTDLIKLKKSGDERNLAVLLESAVLPDADTWMRESFSEPLGPAIARA